MLVVLLALAVLGALAAGGVIEIGSRAKLPYSTFGNVSEGTGALMAGTVHRLPIAAPDPAGGPPWGMRELSTSRGTGCLQIGRIVDGKLGALGQDHAFGDDGRFHELPVAATPTAANCSTASTGCSRTSPPTRGRPAPGSAPADGSAAACRRPPDL